MSDEQADSGGEWTWETVEKLIADAKSVNEYPSDRIAVAHNRALKQLRQPNRLQEAAQAIFGYCIEHPENIRDIPDEIFLPFQDALESTKEN